MTLDDLLTAQRGVLLTRQLAACLPDRAARRRAERTLLRPVLHGVLAGRADRDPLLVARAALLVLPGAVLRGRSALRLHGVDAVPVPERVELYVPPGADASGRPELAVRRATLGAGDTVEVAGLAVTSPVRTALDLAADLPRPDALAVLDAVLHSGGCRPDELTAAVRPGGRGVRQLRELLALADGRAESPPESRLRLQLLDAGLPPPQVQLDVRTAAGHLLARVDLGYREVKLYLEYDGLIAHSAMASLARDRQRSNDLAGAGWVGLRFVARDLHTCAPAALVRQELRRLGHPLLGD